MVEACVDLNLPGRRYQIRIKPGALDDLGAWVRQVARHDHAALFADRAVLDRFGSVARRSLAANGYDPLVVTVPSGETHKNLDTVRSLYDRMVGVHLERRGPVIALGGGVTGDTVGFAAATYLRGVPFVQCPTTLLAMVDASVGGKVGVNLPQGKNLVGSFYQPCVVVVDTDTLATLPARELRCGLAECVKHGVIGDPALFDWLEQNLEAVLALDAPSLVEVVERNVRIKAGVVEADEKEVGRRAHLNFGHTFAHAIEATTGYGGAYHHGEAVSLGMVAATRLAVEDGRCEGGVLDRLTGLLERIGLPTRADDLPDTAVLTRAMRLDKKVVGGGLRLVLPDGLGAVSVVGDVPDRAIASAWGWLRGGGPSHG